MVGTRNENGERVHAVEMAIYNFAFGYLILCYHNSDWNAAVSHAANLFYQHAPK